MAKDAALILAEKRGADEKTDEKLENVVANVLDGVEHVGEKTPPESDKVVDEELLDEEDEPLEENEEPLDEDLPANELIEAKNLYKALRNPAAAGPLIQALAQQMGMNLNPSSTKQEVKAVKTNITEKLKVALGEFAFLADKIGPVLDSALDEQKAESQEIEQRLEVKQLQNESQRTLDRLAKETKGESRKFEARMVELMDRFHPAANQTTEDYIREVFQIVSRDKVRTQVTNKLADQINKNRKDVPSRIASSGSGARSDNTRESPPEGKKLGTKGAVLFALSQMEKQAVKPLKR